MPRYLLAIGSHNIRDDFKTFRICTYLNYEYVTKAKFWPQFSTSIMAVNYVEKVFWYLGSFEKTTTNELSKIVPPTQPIVQTINHRKWEITWSHLWASSILVRCLGCVAPDSGDCFVDLEQRLPPVVKNLINQSKLTHLALLNKEQPWTKLS